LAAKAYYLHYRPYWGEISNDLQEYISSDVVTLADDFGLGGNTIIIESGEFHNETYL
jgi:hypothetical protein